MAAKSKDKIQRRAAQLYIHQNLTLVDIERLEGMPTRQTLAKWRDAGEGNDGTPWDDAKELIRQEARIQARATIFEQSRQEFANLRERAKADIVQAVADLRVQLSGDGAKNPSWTDLKHLWEFALKLEAGTAHEMILDFMKDFLRDVGKIIVAEVEDAQTVNRIHVRLKDLMVKYEEKLDPIRQLLKK